MFILIPSCPADMPRAGAEASVVSVPMLGLVCGVGRHLALRPDVDIGAQWARRCGGICKALAQALARRLDPYAADVWHGAAPIDERLVPQRSSLASCTGDPIAPAA